MVKKSIWRATPPFLLVFFGATLFSFAQEKVTFRVCDYENNPLPYANIRFLNSSQGTITNSNGYFQASIATNQKVSISYLGYQTITFSTDTLTSGVIRLNKVPIGLSEITIKPSNGINIVEKALEKIPQNFYGQKNRQRAFYREYLYQDNQLKTVTESSLSILKMPYNEKINDILSIEKGQSFVHDSSDIDIINGPFAVFRQCDIVKNKSYILNKKSLSSHVFLLKSIIHDNDRSLYEIRFFPKKKNAISGEKYSGEIFIDSVNFSIVKANIEKLTKDGKKSGNWVAVNYELFGRRYTLSNAQKQVLKRNNKAKVELAITDFEYANFEEEPQKIEKGIPLNEYITPNYSSAQTILPDSISTHKFLKNNRRTSYEPAIELFYETNFLEQVNTLSKNLNSVGYLSNYLIYKGFINGMIWSLSQTFFHYCFFNPLSMVLAESALLRKNNISHEVNPFVFNKNLSSFCKVNNTEELRLLHDKNLLDYVRTGTVRNELIHSCIDNMEDLLFEKDYNMESSSNIFYIDLFLKRSTLFINHLMIGQEYVEAGEQADRGLRTIYLLTADDKHYSYLFKKTDLTPTGQKMMSRAKWFSMLNLVSPYIIGIHNIELSKNINANFSFGYMLTPVGEAYIQNYWLKISQDIYKLNFTLYRLSGNIGYHAELDLLNKKVTKRFDLRTKLIACNTSTYLHDYSIPNSIGIGFEQELKYMISSRCNLTVGYSIKSPGYFSSTLSSTEDFQLKTGISWKL